jgi:microcystin-dependent protein
MEFWGSAVPAKWIFAHGQALSRVTYSQLFAIFGGNFGVGDGSTTFNVPDVRGRVVAAADNMGGTAAGRLVSWTFGVAGGAQGHNLIEAELPPHAHGVTDPGHAHGVTDPGHAHGQPQYAGSWNGSSNDFSGPGTKGSYSSAATSGAATGISINGASTGISIQNTGDGAGHNNVQPTIAANYIIYAGV